MYSLKGSYNLKCDIWSIGVITYMLLSGRPPFDGENENEIFKNVAKGHLHFPKKAFRGVSELGKAFVRYLLERDVNQRVTAEEALSHKWIADFSYELSPYASPRGELPKDISGSTVSENPNEWKNNSNLQCQKRAKQLADVTDRLQAFSKYTAFKRAAIFAVAYELDQTTICDLRKKFRAIDTSNDGLVTYSEACKVLRECGGMQDDEIKKIYESMDLEHNKTIEYTQFVAAMLSQRIYLDEEALRRAFHKFDHDHSGFITSSDLKSCLGSRYTEAEVKKMIDDADFKHTGKISFESFLDMMRGRIASPVAKDNLYEAHMERRSSRVSTESTRVPDDARIEISTCGSNVTSSKPSDSMNPTKSSEATTQESAGSIDPPPPVNNKTKDTGEPLRTFASVVSQR
eukprot:g4240.t1